MLNTGGVTQPPKKNIFLPLNRFRTPYQNPLQQYTTYHTLYTPPSNIIFIFFLNTSAAKDGRWPLSALMARQRVGYRPIVHPHKWRFSLLPSYLPDPFQCAAGAHPGCSHPLKRDTGLCPVHRWRKSYTDWSMTRLCFLCFVAKHKKAEIPSAKNYKKKHFRQTNAAHNNLLSYYLSNK